MIPSNDVVAALDEKNNFIYTEFTNYKGQISRGWLAKQDMINTWGMDKKKVKGASAIAMLTPEDIIIQLVEAKKINKY